jgi:hypothetical protein
MRRTSTDAFVLKTGAFIALALTAVGGACTTPPPVRMNPVIPTPPERDRETAAMYPTLTELYQGAQGIYRGCGPNGNVCHNARQYPNLNSLGAITLSINQPCNQLQDDPSRMDDWCERQGDTVRIGNQRIELGYIQRLSDATETMGSRWLIAVQGDLPMLGENTGISIIRVREGRSDDYLIGFDREHLSTDPMRPNALIAQVDLDEEYKERILARAGIPAESNAIQFGDPNRNGVYGRALGNALIVPGHPERSYLIRRLIDPTAGPLMPLANCCFWSKPSLRAMWCWIAGLRPDGSNAMAPIDYAMCPDGPVESVQYPTPGPMCESAGLCPVRATNAIPDEATWANVYNNVLVPRCGGSGCHRGGDTAGNLDLGSEDAAYNQIVRAMPARITAGNAATSPFYQRLTQPCAMGASCRRMPLGQPSLPANELSVVARWIEGGARRDGMLTPDVMVPDAMIAPEAGPDVVADTGVPTDSGVVDTGVTVDTGVVVDTGVPMDSGGGMDASAPDAAGSTDAAGE